eukprot:scaffold177058_cov49-Attheya_sp.AAC.2
MMTRWGEVGTVLLSLTSLSTCVHAFAPPRSSSAVRPASASGSRSFVGDGRRINIVGLPHQHQHQQQQQQLIGTTELHLFRRLLRRQDRGNSTKSEDNTENSNKEESGLPFFAASNENVSDNGDSSTEVLAVASTITTTATTPTEEKSAPPATEEELDPIAKALAEAKVLKASAQRVRLEAERLDARLTLDKITKLETELGSNSITNKPDRASEIQNQMDLLQRKLRGESAPSPPPKTLISKSVGDGVTTVSSAAMNTESISSKLLLGQTSKNVKTLEGVELEKRVEEFQNAPAFFRNMVARSAGMNPESLNATALILKLYQDEQLGSASAIEGIFTPLGRMQVVSDEVNATSVARDMFSKGFDDARQPYDTFFPSLRKNEDKAPSLQDVNSFLSEVLAKSNGAFQPSESPMKINGGYVIRGTSRFENGTQVMDAIEERLDSFPRLRHSLTVSYVTDVFLSIQLSHELAHRAVAANYGCLIILTPPLYMLSTKHQFNISLPTFVPSIATGLTATSTSFKSPPKDNTELFDFAIAGPLVGMIFSLVALAVGMNWTLYSDASFLPALPLTFLRQSSLAGGIIESVLGAGALYVPAGADIASVASINISMHPLAITDYIIVPLKEKTLTHSHIYTVTVYYFFVSNGWWFGGSRPIWQTHVLDCEFVNVSGHADICISWVRFATILFRLHGVLSV